MSKYLAENKLIVDTIRTLQIENKKGRFESKIFTILQLLTFNWYKIFKKIYGHSLSPNLKINNKMITSRSIT